MKNIKFVFLFLLFIISVLPLASFVKAENTPNYVGIKENQIIIWNTEFDLGPVSHYYEDLGYPELYAENFSYYFFDCLGLSEDKTELKIVILSLGEEKEFGEYLGVPYFYNKYEENGIDERNKKGVIYEYDKEAYQDKTFLDIGLFFLIVSNHIDWDELVEEIDEKLDKDYKDASASREKSLFFYMEKNCGISTTYKPEYPSDMENFRSISRYTEDGILLYYECSYDEEIFIKIELEGAYLYNNWWWILLIGISIAIAFSAIVVVIIIIIKKDNVK